ncbi:MAG: flavodoxin [Deltaproteobacteria bacterium]|jgi:flavodoxin|nr:flavodoxin [Deltaproteobacteria bacterium]
MPQNNILTVFYSWSGNVRNVANLIQQKIGGDLLELILQKPYSSDYKTCANEAVRDKKMKARPELSIKIPPIDKYSVIIIGYPNWIGTIPMPIATFLEGQDLSGKTILPYCCHGGGGVEKSVSDIIKLSPQAKVLEPLNVRDGDNKSLEDNISAWLKKNGIVE